MKIPAPARAALVPASLLHAQSLADAAGEAAKIQHEWPLSTNQRAALEPPPTALKSADWSLRAESNGFTLIELLIVVAIIGIIAAIAVPGLLRARMAGNEASAIGSLRAINSGQATFSSSCASGGYAIKLEDLVLPPVGSSQGFVSPDLKLNGVTKSGYTVTVSADSGSQSIGGTSVCGNTVSQPVSGFFAKANPVSPGSSGTRYFATDTRGTIWQNAALTISAPITGSVTVTPVQ